jgi:hemolysin III
MITINRRNQAGARAVALAENDTGARAVAFAEGEAKPLLRGWSHGLAALAALAVAPVLLEHARGDGVRSLAVGVFGVTMLLMYAVSATLHLGRWRPATHRALCRLDYTNIFLMIAGSYTPICVAVLSGWWRTAMLALIWSLTLAGIAGIFCTAQQPRWAQSAQYLGLGWVGLAMLPAMVGAYSFAPVLVLLVGGALYSFGAVAYARRWPRLWPGVFGFHELFHLCVVGGSATTVAVVWFWLLG